MALNKTRPPSTWPWGPGLQRVSNPIPLAFAFISAKGNSIRRLSRSRTVTVSATSLNRFAGERKNYFGGGCFKAEALRFNTSGRMENRIKVRGNSVAPESCFKVRKPQQTRVINFLFEHKISSSDT